MNRAPLDWITGFLLEALASETPIDARGLTFLLRQYRDTDRTDLREALEPALARALDRSSEGSVGERAEWLTLFGEAAASSNDDRLSQAAARLVESLRRDLRQTPAVDEATAGLEACLACRDLVEVPALVPDAIDELERIVSATYSPGEGLARRVNDPSGLRGRLADHVRVSSALLTAFEVTGRLPYSMLAEELMGWAKRMLWDADEGLFRESQLDAGHPFVLNCEAARVSCRLAVLQSEDVYRRAAVPAPGADYRNDALRILSAEDGAYQQHGLASAIYGLALIDCLRLP